MLMFPFHPDHTLPQHGTVKVYTQHAEIRIRFITVQLVCGKIKEFETEDCKKQSVNTGRKMDLGPIYTMAKCHNHEFVRALETHSKALPWRIEIKFVCGHEPSSVL